MFLHKANQALQALFRSFTRGNQRETMTLFIHDVQIRFTARIGPLSGHESAVIEQWLDSSNQNLCWK